MHRAFTMRDRCERRGEYFVVILTAAVMFAGIPGGCEYNIIIIIITKTVIVLIIMGLR